MKGANCFALVVAGVFWSATALAAEKAAEKKEMIEQITVTGSYLQRTAADSPSPIAVLSALNIEELGVADAAEIIQTLPWQSGSQTRASTFQGEGADGRATVNLRNLGHGATLPLVNGKRQVPSWYNPRGEASVNINGLMPNIAVQRIEIVKDGSSALYGSDAIAGVVNFITKRNFEGLDFNYQATTDQETREGTANEAEVMFGVQSDRGGVMVAGAFLNRDEINVDDRYDRFGGSTASATGQPGRFVPVAGQTIRWAANGLNPGQPVDRNAFPRNAQGTSFGQADVNCEDAAKLEQGGPLGPVLGNNVCAYDFGSFFALQAKEQLRKMYAIGHYDLTKQVDVYFEFAQNDSQFDRRNSLNPNAPGLRIPVSSPGSIEDAFRRGIEPIVVSNLTRLLGGTRNTDFRDRPIDTLTHSTYSDQRLMMGAAWDGKIMDKNWRVDASFTASEHKEGIIQVQDTLSSHMELAIQGKGGPNCDVINGTPGEGNLAYAASGGKYTSGKCYFFNPYGSNRFARNGTRQTDLKLVNPAELYTWLSGRANSEAQYRERVIDLVATGDLFDFGGLPVRLAVGIQRRVDSGLLLLDSSLTSGNLDFVFGASDWKGHLKTTGVFTEIGVPIGKRLEINAAIRHESVDEINQNTTDPKISLLWRPLDSLSVRASWGTSFRVPSLQQLFGSLTTVANESDIGGTAFIASITDGNAKLAPETATTYNIGFSWQPTEGWLDGFQVDMDYYNVTYEDIITREASAAILLADNTALRAAIAAGTPLAEAVAAGIGNRRQVVRNADGRLLRILPDFINANSADIDGVDLSTSYSFSTPFGDWRLGVQGAWARTYDVKVGTVTFKAVGNYNEFNPVARPLPEYKANGTINWRMNDHRVFMLVQWVDSLDYGINLNTDPRGGAARFWREAVRLANGNKAANDFFTRNIHSMTTVDLTYSYTFRDTAYFSGLNTSIGVKNVFNEEPPYVPVVTGYDGRLHDPRGRVWFVRMTGNL